MVALAGPARADNAQYFYDAAGRLTAMVDPVNGSAQYSYDAVGNILSVTRLPLSAVMVAQVSPYSAAPGNIVTIAGTGFSSTSDTSVSFNGAAATPSAVTSTSLTVMVPSGATTGPVTVTSPAGSATTTASFAVPATPVIGSFSPTQVDAGSSITISGSGFDPVSGANKVKINGRFAAVTAATSTSLTVLVPVVGSGKVTVQTVGGLATSTSPLIVPPPSFLAANIGSVTPSCPGSTSCLGSTLSVSINASGQFSIVLFDVAAGQRVAALLTNNPFLSILNAAVFGPDGSQVGTSVYTATTSGFLSTPILSIGGTYSLIVWGQSTTSINTTLVAVPADATTTLTANNSPSSLTTTTMGQRFALSFGGTNGQRIDLQGQAGSGIAGPYYGTLTITQPDGLTQLYQNSSFLNSLTGALTLPTTGTYTALFTPTGAEVGTETFTLYNVPPDLTSTITANGSPVSLTTATPGQNISLTFNGTAGQRVSLTTQPASAAAGGSIAVVQPDGTTTLYASSAGSNPDYSGLLVLPVSGTYTIQFRPSGAGVGTDTFTLYTVPADAQATLAANGTAVQVTTTTPGQGMALTFSGTAGQRINLQNSPGSGQTSGCSKITITAPDGQTQVFSNSCFNYAPSLSGVLTLPATGTYQLSYKPPAADTGTDTFTLYNVPPDVTSAITANGTPLSLSTSTPGQNFNLTFSGTAGQRISFENQPGNGQTSGCASVKIVAPDGTTQAYSNSCFNYSPSFTDVLALATTGTYQIQYTPPPTDTGTTTFTLYNVPPDAGATVTPGGGSVGLTTTQPGQNFMLTFSATAGQRVSLLAQADSSFDPQCPTLTVTAPDGSTQLYNALNCSQSTYTGVLPKAAAITATPPTLSATGTYTINYNPRNTATGTAYFTLYAVPADASASTTIGAATVNVTTTAPGQALRMSFPGSANQQVKVHVSQVSVSPGGGCSQATTLQPDGTTILRGELTCGSNYSSSSLTLPVSGTYTLVFGGIDTAAGTYAVSVSSP